MEVHVGMSKGKPPIAFFTFLYAINFYFCSCDPRNIKFHPIADFIVKKHNLVC